MSANAWTLSITFTIILAIFFLEAIFYGFVTFRDPDDLGYYLYLHQHMLSTFEGFKFCVSESCRAMRVLYGRCWKDLGFASNIVGAIIHRMRKQVETEVLPLKQILHIS